MRKKRKKWGQSGFPSLGPAGLIAKSTLENREIDSDPISAISAFLEIDSDPISAFLCAKSTLTPFLPPFLPFLHALRAAGALQLAAAFVAAEQWPSSLEMMTLDDHHAGAARKEGFVVGDIPSDQGRAGQ